MKVIYRTTQAIISIAWALSISSMATAAPHCPPQYQEICKQLIKTLEDNNDGKHFYKWDGTHLVISGNFALYDSINHSSTDHRTGNVNTTVEEFALSKDYFPHLLSQIAAASQGGERVYLHLFYGWGLDKYTVAGVSNTPVSTPVLAPPNTPPTPVNAPNLAPPKVPPKIPQAVPKPMMVPVLAPPNIPPTPVNAPNLAPPKVPPKIPQAVPLKSNQPVRISVTHNVKNRNGIPVDKQTVNGHFLTYTAGNHLDQESRAYLLDDNSDVWSCMVSGLSQRTLTGGDGSAKPVGHAETLEFRSTHIAHIPANHPMHPGCLISVQQ